MNESILNFALNKANSTNDNYINLNSTNDKKNNVNLIETNMTTLPPDLSDWVNELVNTKLNEVLNNNNKSIDANDAKENTIPPNAEIPSKPAIKSKISMAGYSLVASALGALFARYGINLSPDEILIVVLSIQGVIGVLLPYWRKFSTNTSISNFFK